MEAQLRIFKSTQELKLVEVCQATSKKEVRFIYPPRARGHAPPAPSQPSSPTLSPPRAATRSQGGRALGQGFNLRAKAVTAKGALLVRVRP